MTTTIRVFGGTATVAAGVWSASAPELLPLVQGWPVDETTYVPDWDYAEAQAAAAALGGEVIADAGPPTVPDDAVA